MSAVAYVDHVPEIRRALTDVRGLCGALNLLDGAKRQPGGNLSICCPTHGEKNPSCSVSIGGDGTIRVKCFSCDWGGDALSLVAAARGLDLTRDFKDVLREAADIAGLSFDELGVGGARAPYVPPKPVKADDRTYPLPSEVGSLWARCVPVTEQRDVAAWLESRGLDAETIARLNLARALPDGLNLPRWASYRGEAESASPWDDLGYRLIMPVWDDQCAMRSVRAGRVIDGPGPKRLPPAGRLATGLLLANKAALAIFGHGAKADLLIVEGEPDFFTWACAVAADDRMVGVVGVGSGWWSRAFAAKVPRGCRVVIRTHQDAAGDKYAADIGLTLARRAKLFRPAQDGFGDENDRLRAGKLGASFDADVAPLAVDSVDPASFPLGRLFAEYYWLGDELKPGVFAVRCPGEIVHNGGARFDGSTVIQAPTEGEEFGTLRCRHDQCVSLWRRFDQVGNAVARLAAAEGL
jgi:hypothetical protein